MAAVLIAAGCARNFGDGDEYWRRAYYSMPTQTDGYYSWGSRGLNRYQYYPTQSSFSPAVPRIYFYFYPPYLFRPTYTTQFSYSPPWWSSSYFFYPQSSGPSVTPAPVATPTPAPVQTASYRAVGDIHFFSNEGQHYGGGGNPCSSLGNYQMTGFIADCGGARCWGNEIVCEKHTTQTTPTSSSASIAVDFFVTAEGAHVVGGPGCPAGYRQVGSAADCGGGTCYGNQNFCLLTVPASSMAYGGQYISDVLITASAHIVGGTGCPGGYASAGSVADCVSRTSGTCYGNQLVCVAKASAR